MKLPRDFDGVYLAKKLQRLGFETIRQKGSHIVLRHSESGETISIPAHRPLKVGILSSLLGTIAALNGLSRDELLKAIID